MASKWNFEETKLINDFYPCKKQKELTIIFRPLKILVSSDFIKYLNTAIYLTEEQKSLLNYIFGDSSSVEDLMGHEGEVEAENPVFETNVFHKPGKIDLCISKTGKEEDSKTFNWLRYKSSYDFKLNSFYNFIHYIDGVFYGVDFVLFNSQMRTLAYNKELRKMEEEVLKEMYDEFNNENYDDVGEAFFQDMPFKCSSITLTKLLISFFPNIPTNNLTKLVDYIQSELLSKKTKAEPSKSIFELKGELITYFYNSKNYQYESEGSLGNSCMKGDGVTERIRFYANNPTNVSLLTYIENKKLLARTVLWTHVDGTKFADRIYCSSSKYAIELAAYCKQNNYKTLYSSTYHEYGVPYSTQCIVALDTFELKSNHYPYLDSMHGIDIVNSLVSPDITFLKEYSFENKEKCLVKALSVSGGGGLGYYDDYEKSSFKCNDQKEFKYFKDVNGNTIKSHLTGYTIIHKPKLGLVNRDDIVTVNGTEKVDYNWCEKTLIKKYNSLRPTLTIVSDVKFLQYFDKKHVVYSTYHKIFVQKKESTFLPSLQTYVLKNVLHSNDLLHHIQLIKIKKLYADKLVKITPGYLADLQEQLALLPFKESLKDLRKSRSYCLKSNHILWNGVNIKGILIPFKQLRIVKK